VRVLRGGGEGVRVKLYLVTYSGHGYVVASSPEAAARTARLSLTGSESAGVEVAVSIPTDVTPEWRAAHPLGEHRERNCSEWFSREKP
jgi:hypothetical protein